MNEEVPIRRETVETVPGRTLFRVSWGAIWAGMFVTVVMQIMLTLLGVACGIASLNPASQANSVQGLSVGAAIWLMVTWLISMWCGACVAGRMSGGPRQADGMVHGVVSWAFSTAVILLSLTTIAGTLLSGTIALLGGSAAGNLSALNTARGTGLPALSGHGGGAQVPGRLTALAQTDPQLGNALQQMEAGGGAAQAPVARRQALDLLVNRHRLTPSEANAAINDWNREFQALQGQSNQANSAADHSAAQTVWGTSLWGFIALILGLAAAAWGGSTGVAPWLRRTGTTVTPAA